MGSFERPTIYAGGSKIISSGMVVSYGFQPIDFFVSSSEESGFKIELVFLNNENDRSGVSVKVIGPSHVQVALINFDTPNEQALKSPVYVANHAGRKVLLSIAGNFIGSGETATRLIFYTFQDGGALNA